MLTAEPHGVAATKAGVEQHVKPHALARPDWPAALVGRDVFFGPRNKAVALFAGRVLDASGWVRFNQLRRECPPEQAAHGVEEMPRLIRGPSAPLTASYDGLGRDLSEREEMFRSGALDKEAKNPRSDFRRVKHSLQARHLIGERDDCGQATRNFTRGCP
jgi:hypothetical protein